MRWAPGGGSFYTQTLLDHCVRTSVRVTDFYPQPLRLRKAKYVNLWYLVVIPKRHCSQVSVIDWCYFKGETNYSRPSLIQTTLIWTLTNPNKLMLTHNHYYSILHACELLVCMIHVGQFVVGNVHNTCRTVVVWTCQQFMTAATKVKAGVVDFQQNQVFGQSKQIH